MRVKITTVFDAGIETVWKNLQKPSLLDFIAKPLIKFEKQSHSDVWTEGAFPVKMKLFSLIPVGSQIIKIEIPADNTEHFRRLRDNGGGELIKKWDHWIELEYLTEKQTKYTDIVTIKAGILTPFVWCFALVFYSWRQFRWKRLIAADFRQLN